MPIRMPARLFFSLLIVSVIAVSGVVSMPIRAQDGEAAFNSCDDILYMMGQEKTLDQYIVGAGALLANEAQVSTVNQADIGDRWMLRAGEGSLTVTVNFSAGLALEAALFQGSIPMPDNQGQTGFVPLTSGSPLRFSIPEAHHYNLIVRKQHVADPTAGEYTITADYRVVSRSLPEMRDNSTNQPMSRSQYRLTEEGIEIVSLPSASVYVHAEGVSTAASHGGRAAQVRFNGRGTNYGILINNWAAEIAVLDGSLGVRGEVNGQPRLYYWEDFNFSGDFLEGDLLNLVDGQRNGIQTDWQDIRGIWMMDDCLGVLFHDGHRFLTDLTPASRTVVVRGGLANMEVRLSALGGQANGRVLSLGWDGVPVESLVTYFANTLELDYVGERHLRVQSADLHVTRGNAPDIPAENQRLDITRNDSASTVTLDWMNLQRFELVDDSALFEFMDAPRGVTTRPAASLERIEALDDVILMTYKTTPDGQPGMQRLMLPRQESYLELITPAGFPTFDGRALPGEANYMPRALNNTGADCYPITTLMPEANCPAAGHPNPANGNLWYQVTDLTAYGHLLDLALTRNYNSRMAGIDGPFGPGWSTAALIDHRTAFDPAQSARVVEPEAASLYLVGLDLTWAPRGIVWFTTPTGSQHIFVSETNGGFTTGTLTAPSMPGWRLMHEAVRGNHWILSEDEGATFVFDRAGRLLEFGYPQDQRMITISYPEQIIPALENLQGAPMILTDAPAQRQLELYYDADLHITRSVLRDLSQSPTGEGCKTGCLETRYTYANGLLTEVAYADGSTARYTYEGTTRQLVAHEDPRAPIYTAMRYTYNAQTLALESAELALPGGATRGWRMLETVSSSGDTHTVRLTDENNVSQVYTYRRTGGALREAQDTFALLSTTSPLAGTDSFEDKPVEYQWENGLLTAVKSRLLQNTVGRNSTTYSYTPNGQLIHTGGGFETIRIAYAPDPLTRAPVYYPQSIQFDTGASLEYTYDDQNRLATVTDQHGAVYRYEWGEDGLPFRVTLENDGTTWVYTYNAFGLVSEARQQVSASDVPENDHVIVYTWNNFGELLAVEDSTTGTYTLDYAVMPADGTAYYDTTVTDPTGTQSFYRQNTRRWLLEARIGWPEAEVPLRHTTYTYDLLGRLTAEQQWLYAEDGTSRPVTTTYTYTPLVEMPEVPGEDPGFSRVVNGTQMTVTLPGAQTQVYIFDALGRIRQTKDERNRIYRYHYSVSSGQSYGLRIVQYEIHNNEITDSTAYDFDVRHQLRTIQRGDNTWTFLLDGDTTAVRFLQAPTVGIREMEWSRDGLGRVSDVTVRPLEIQLNSGNKTINTHLHVEYDFLGRQITLSDDTGRTTAITYCPTPLGGTARLDSAPGSSARPGCDASRATYAQAAWYDSAGRLIRASDEFGDRDITYTADPATHEWVVVTTFVPVDEAGAVYQWEQHFSPVGDLLLWIDATGTAHRYTYDTLGRLTVVDVADAPQESFRLTYNDASLLILEEDGLGRGARYDYNRYGQLISKEDLSTRFVTSYDYGPNNLLRSVTSPLGSTTNYLYEDPFDPQLLTGINTASGSANSYQWNLDANTFTYVDPRGYQQIYTFDTLGYLWRIDDALARSHELHYDAIRHLTDWRQNQARNAGPERHLTVNYSPTGDEIAVSAANTDWRWRIGLSGQGNLQSLHNPANQPVTFGYDALGQLARIEAGSRTWTLEREPGARQMSYVDGFGQQRELSYNASLLPSRPRMARLPTRTNLWWPSPLWQWRPGRRRSSLPTSSMRVTGRISPRRRSRWCGLVRP